MSESKGKVVTAPCESYCAGRCGYVGVSAEPVPNEEGQPICSRQQTHWYKRALPCEIPKILAQPFPGNAFAKAEAAKGEAVRVLNAVASENKCEPHRLLTENGPWCKPLGRPCVRVEEPHLCLVAEAIRKTKEGEAKSIEERERVAGAYDAELSRIMTGKGASL